MCNIIIFVVSKRSLKKNSFVQKKMQINKTSFIFFVKDFLINFGYDSLGLQ